jgi:hypothetical protein
MADEDIQVAGSSEEDLRKQAIDDSRCVVRAIHHGRSRVADLEVEAEIVWLFTYEDGLMRRWDMFMSLDDALRAAGVEAPKPG